MELHNTSARLKQLQRLGPSTSTYKLLTEVCNWTDTSVSGIARQIGEHQASVFWAFTTGKSPRAQELRDKVVTALHARLDGETNGEAA
jgi:hypothetical protein